MLNSQQIAQFRRTGHLTVEAVFDNDTIQSALDDIADWCKEFLAELADDQRDWYLEPESGDKPALRKLDNPVFYRDRFRALAGDDKLVTMVEQLIGKGISVFFSQVFMKPPELGGPKPIHQDNFYFGPDNLDAVLTAWIALDDATIDNGCLYYCDQHQTEIAPHIAPADQPYNLQIEPKAATGFAMVAAPVPRGGISFHHGNTPHQSSSNRSDLPRRAAAFHYLRNDAKLVKPALPYDDTVIVRIT